MVLDEQNLVTETQNSVVLWFKTSELGMPVRTLALASDETSILEKDVNTK